MSSFSDDIHYICVYMQRCEKNIGIKWQYNKRYVINNVILKTLYIQNRNNITS